MNARQAEISDLQTGRPMEAAGMATLPGRSALRARLLRSGTDALDDAELLGLFLAKIIPEADSSRLALRLIEAFGDLATILSTPAPRLAAACGLSPDALEDLSLIEAMSHRLARARVMNREVISSWDALVRYCRVVMAHRGIEQLRLLFLDRKNVLIADELQQQGTIDHVPVYPREVVKRALELNAAALILVHNHPSGDPTPSQSDIDMTARVRAGLETVGIELHDHIVIGRDSEASFRSRGLL